MTYHSSLCWDADHTFLKTDQLTAHYPLLVHHFYQVTLAYKKCWNWTIPNSFSEQRSAPPLWWIAGAVSARVKKKVMIWCLNINPKVQTLNPALVIKKHVTFVLEQDDFSKSRSPDLLNHLMKSVCRCCTWLHWFLGGLWEMYVILCKIFTLINWCYKTCELHTQTWHSSSN